MSRDDLATIQPFFGEGARVVGHAVLVNKGGETMAFMRMMPATRKTPENTS